MAGPLGEVEADESVVGLMALHIMAGEWPVFYWGQPYLGSLEAYLVAAAFAAVGPSNLVLKIVPAVVYLVFAALVFAGARRDYGDRVALLSGLYLALPPSFLALWSLKARGGYIELLALGQGLLFLAPWAVRPGQRLSGRLGLLGLLSGLLLWTHVLGLAYVLPAVVFAATRVGRRLLGWPLLAALGGGLLGLGPALAYNVANDWETLAALAGGSFSLEVFQHNLEPLLEIGLPIMLGFGQATSSPVLFAEDWPRRPGSWPWVPPLLLGLVICAVLPSLAAASRVFRARAAGFSSTAFFGVAILLLTPLLASLGRFGDLVAEPRYALPLYSALPLFAVALVKLAEWRPALGVMTAAAVLVLNVGSLLTVDPRLNLPTTAAGSTQANRADLLDYLSSRGITEIYTDYWLTYPLVFESREAIMASVISGGYNRFAPYAYFVAVSEQPAFVFIADSAELAAFDRRLESAGGRARRERVGPYEVATGVQPLDPWRP